MWSSANSESRVKRCDHQLSLPSLDRNVTPRTDLLIMQPNDPFDSPPSTFSRRDTESP
jgi:hypothetical protein